MQQTRRGRSAGKGDPFARDIDCRTLATLRHPWLPDLPSPSLPAKGSEGSGRVRGSTSRKQLLTSTKQPLHPQGHLKTCDCSSQGALHEPEIVLSPGVALVGRLSKPAQGSRLVLRDTVAVEVHDSEVVLSCGL